MRKEVPINKVGGFTGGIYCRIFRFVIFVFRGYCELEIPAGDAVIRAFLLAQPVVEKIRITLVQVKKF